MFSLPPAKKEWRCGYKWENGEEVDTGKGCGQRIYQSSTEKFPSGKYKIKNAENGRGGKRGEDHLCHNTGYHGYDPTWGRKYILAMTRWGCAICGIEFSLWVFPVCPNCFHRECRKCLHHWPWKIDADGYSVIRECPKCQCKELDVHQQQWSYSLKYLTEYDESGVPKSELV